MIQFHVTLHNYDFQPLSHKNQMYDESLEVPDAEDIPSVYTPSPKMASFGNQGDTENHLRNFYLPLFHSL